MRALVGEVEVLVQLQVVGGGRGEGGEAWASRRTPKGTSREGMQFTLTSS
jgi:hypothetical protein